MSSFAKITESFYLKQPANIKGVFMREYDLDNHSNYNITVLLDLKTSDGEYESVVINPTVETTNALFDSMADIAYRFNLVKLSKYGYISQDIFVRYYTIEEYAGDYPERSDKYLIMCGLSDGSKQWLGTFTGYDAALEEFQTLQDLSSS